MKRELSGESVESASMVRWLGIVLVLAVMQMGAPALFAAEKAEDREAASEQHESAGEEHEATGEEHGEGHHLHKHHVALFLGTTEGVEPHVEHHENGHADPHGEGSGADKEDPSFTIGFDYERRFSKLFGFGGMIDWVVEGNREMLIGPIAFLHPYGKSKFYVAPCYERVRETQSNEFVLRVGASWDFDVGKFSVGPNLMYDFSDEHNLWVVGVGIGKGW